MKTQDRNTLLADRLYEMVSDKITSNLAMSMERTTLNLYAELERIKHTNLWYYLNEAYDNLGKTGYIREYSTRHQKIASYILSCVDTTVFGNEKPTYQEAFDNIIKDLNKMEYEDLHLYYYLRNAEAINPFCNMEYLEDIVNKLSEKLGLEATFQGLDGLSLTWDFDNGSYFSNFSGYGLYFGSGKPLMKDTIRYYENPNTIENTDPDTFIKEVVQEFKDYEEFMADVGDKHSERLQMYKENLQKTSIQCEESMRSNPVVMRSEFDEFLNDMCDGR